MGRQRHPWSEIGSLLARTAGFSAVLLVGLLAARYASGQDSLSSFPRATELSSSATLCASAPRRVRFDFVVPPELAALEPEVREDLAAELAEEGIAVCGGSESAGAAPLAIIGVREEAPLRLRLSVSVPSQSGEERQERLLELTRVPRDGWALALAVALDELMAASRSLAALRQRALVERRAEEERRLAEEARRRAIGKDSLAKARGGKTEPNSTEKYGASSAGARPPPNGQNAAVAAIALQHYALGMTELGVDLRLALALSRLLEFGFGASWRRGLPLEALHGSVSSEALGGLLALRLNAFATSNVRFAFELGAAVLYTTFTGHADPGFEASAVSGWTSDARAGTALSWTSLPAQLQLSAGAGVPFLRLEALDAGQLVAGHDGIFLYTALGAGLAW